MPAERPKRRSASKIGKQTRSAYERGRALLDRLGAGGILDVLEKDEEAAPLLEQLQQDLLILSMAPQLRIGAARRLQGLSSRRRTLSQMLFDACVELRRRVKLRFRGPRHAELRRAFGEGQPASPSKPGTTLALAEIVLAAAAAHPDALREVSVRAATLERLDRLRDRLRASTPERTELRGAQNQVSQNLLQLGERVSELCDALDARAGQFAPAAAAQPLARRDPK